MAGKVEYGWARSGDLHIAYEVRGDAPVDLVLVPGLINTLTASKVVPRLARVDDELCRFARVIKLDKRGTGLSDRFPAGPTPTVEERMDDVRAVMDAVGSERACVMGTADGGPIAMMFAATYPERVASLVLDSTAPRTRWAPDWPWGSRDEERDVYLSLVKTRWGQGVMGELFGASEELRQDYAALERLAGTPPTIIAAVEALAATDVRDTLATITAPTLVVHTANAPIWPIEGGRYLAEHIADARFLELAERTPTDVVGSAVPERIAAIEELMTGARPAPVVDRVLKTVLFTDIVGSTEQAAQLGDRRWRLLLDAHDAAVRAVVEDHRGEEINTTGDGFLVAFDGPARGAIRCAQRIAVAGRDIDIRVRAGIHTGECERRGDDLSGIAVHIGARVAALAGDGEVLVTGTVRDLVAGSGIEFEDRGLQSLKGVPGHWRVLAVSDGSRPAPA